LRLGQLVPGDMLPSASAVVAATAVNPNTVLKAYRELEREGLVDTRQGRGTFVRASLAQPGTQAGSPLRDELRVWMATARAGGLEREDVAALLAAELDVFFPPRPVGSR
jgi:GntR family transcriptional regulator